ncbi:radical SAM/SPASM domain-containing protein [Methanoplanus limicola]|uniref:Radical SAM domain protein n=1 Tax=Methanoplanus limicola DSM 2279 TaxID=937775 RepID=H1Z412_9EURY|nr:radical SAM protein [Methanoplanus limicola]EHQ35691.1 Radical SAM domain protein [Methanoplanus limicola DSM 2279]
MNRITQCLHGRGTVSEMSRHLHGSRNQSSGRNIAFSGTDKPVIFWNVTNRCNLFCKHCYSSSGSDSGNEDLSNSQALSLIDDLSGMGIPLIIFTGGEPLLREDIFELAGYARSKGIATALSSNGTLITAKSAFDIKNSGIDYVGISLDGASAETHNRFRGSSDAFELTTTAFKHCRNAGLRSGVRVTINKENYGELEDLIDLAVNLGASRFCLYWLVPSGRGAEAYNNFQLEENEVNGVLSLLYRKAKEISPAVMEFLTVDAPQDAIHLLASMNRDGSEDLAAAKHLVASLNGGCSAGTRVANISHRGYVYPCQFAQSDEFCIGDINEIPFSSLWGDGNNPVIALFRKKTLLLEGKCKNCQHKMLCGGGCRVRANYMNNDFYSEDPFCFIREELNINDLFSDRK